MCTCNCSKDENIRNPIQVFDKAWVSEDGSWGTNAIVMFEPDSITDEQMEILDNLNDNDKYDYIIAIFNGDDLDEWENQ
jgi:hypothetical protein